METIENEVWKAIPNYENLYEASTCGRIKRLLNMFQYLRQQEKQIHLLSILAIVVLESVKRITDMCGK